MKKMLVVQGTNIAEVTIVKETSKTYRIDSKQSIGGYVSVWNGSLVRKSYTSLQWFDNPKDAFACLIANQEKEVVRIEHELSEIQTTLSIEKEALQSWKMQYAEKYEREQQ